MPPPPMGANKSLDSILGSFVLPGMREGIEFFNRQLGVAFDLGNQIALAPWQVLSEYLKANRRETLLDYILSRKSEFVVTRELNQAMYGAIGDANPIHHNIEQVVGYGTIFGFEFLRLRSGLPPEQLISLDASYHHKMFEGDKISVKYAEGRFLPDDSLYLRGVGMRGDQVLTTYQYTLRLIGSGREFPLITEVNGSTTVPEIVIPHYTESELRKRVNMEWSTKLSVDSDSLKNIATVFSVLRGGKFSDFDRVWGNRDLTELYVAGAISNAMATLGGEGTLFRDLKIQFVNPLEYNNGLSVKVGLNDVSISGNEENFKLPFSGEAHRQDGRLIARYAPFGLLPVAHQPS